MWEIEVCIVALLTIFTIRWVFKWRNPPCNGVLPPGSMGLPLIGETLELFIPSHSLDLLPFVQKRIRRYGHVFRTSLAGRPVVISADPEFNNFILQQEGKLVEIWYMDTFAKMHSHEGDSIVTAPGTVHKYVRNIILNHFGSESLRKKMLAQIEEMVNKTLKNWSTRDSINVKSAVATMVFNFSANKIFNYDPEDCKEKLSEKFSNFINCLMAFPVNIPGTAYHKCLKDYKKVMKMIKDVVKERLNSTEEVKEDLVAQAIKDMTSSEKFLTEDFIVKFSFGMLFASFESISTTLTLTFTLLAQNPLVLQELMAEHERLIKKRENLDAPLTWDEYKSMTFTHQVIHETLRLANTVPGILRRALKDIHIKGYTIPAGWAIMAATPALQLNPNTFKDPLAFNPWRWKEMEANVISKNFMPFGGGGRQCAGAEYSKSFMATFLHVLITKFRWTKVKGGGVVRKPLLQFEDGFHIRVTEKEAS